MFFYTPRDGSIKISGSLRASIKSSGKFEQTGSEFWRKKPSKNFEQITQANNIVRASPVAMKSESCDDLEPNHTDSTTGVFDA